MKNERKIELSTIRVIRGDYVIAAVQNAFNNKVSFWISKRGYTDAYYCFTADNVNEVMHQIDNGWEGYVRLYKTRHDHLN